MNYPSKDPILKDPGTATVQKTSKTFIEEFGDKINVDDTTYIECVIAFKRGVTFKWIRDVDHVPYKIFLNDQDFDQ